MNAFGNAAAGRNGVNPPAAAPEAIKGKAETMKTINLIGIASLALGALLAGSADSSALCVKDCTTKTSTRSVSSVTNNRSRTSNQQTINAQDSFDQTQNAGRDARNSVLGNMDVRIGHQGLSISNVAEGATIDNTINSTIVMGNVGQ